MKKILLITGLCIQSMAYAESRPLPPIINNSSYANGMPYSGSSPTSKPMLEMLGRIEILQVEIQQLRGLVEQQAHEINKFKKRQKNIYADINVRLQQLEAINGIGDNISENVTAPLVPEQTTVAVNKVVPKAGEKAAFNTAFASVKNSHYQQAITLFKQFLDDYPAGEYSDNATFWLASAYKVSNDLAKAKVNFQLVYTQFPQSEKASLAKLKLADIYFEENNLLKAKQLYMQISTQYADTTVAHVAAKKLHNIGQ